MKLDEYIKTKKNLGEWIVHTDPELSNSSKFTLIKTEAPELNTNMTKARPKLELLVSNKTSSNLLSDF